MKVLICHYGILDRGGFSRNFNLAKGLVKLGHTVVLLTSSNSIKFFGFPYKKIERDGVNVLVFYDFFPTFLLWGGFGFISTIMKSLYSIFNRFDIVQSDTGQRPAAGLPCLLNKFIYKSKYISEWWDYYGIGGHFDEKKIIKKITIGLYDNVFEVNNKKIADGIVCITEGMKARAISLGIDENKITVINGGADYESIAFFDNNEDIKKEFGFNKSKIIFGLISVEDSEINGLKYFFSAISSEQIKDKVFCVTFGFKLNDKVLKKYLPLENIYQFGWINYIEESIKLSVVDFFIILKEENLINETGWPNKTGDCLAVGRQIITNGTGDLIKYINNYPDAFIYCKNDIESITKKIQELISNYDYYKSKRKKVREIAEQDLSWLEKSKDLESFYLKILSMNN